MSSPTSPAIALQDLPGLRSRTERIAEALRGQLATHLETLKPMYVPARIFGKFAGGKIEVPTDERALADVKEKFPAYSGSPFNLPALFEPHWLTLTGSALELIPWEYSHDIGGRKITMTAPLRWVLNYKSGLAIGKLRAAASGEAKLEPELLRQFVVNALALQAVLRFTPGFMQLFADLRYEMKIEALPEFKGLPLVTVTSCLESFRPADDLITAATAFSGVPAFVELLDIEASKNPRDLLKERIEQLLG
jgi:hypothetical protein